MWIMAGSASFAHRSMFENEWSGLFPMTLRTRLVQPAHCETMRRFHNVQSMWIMTLDAIHLPLCHGVMLRQVKFGADILMAFVTGLRILSGIDDQFFPTRSTYCHMLARRAMA
jgi:hypothetical protein